jgi:hypothetical protein
VYCGFGFLVVFSQLLFVLSLLIVNFFQIVSACGCKLVKSNHVNLGVQCDWFNFIMLLWDPKFILS